MPLKDGTYIVRDGELHEHVMAFGYYVATRPVADFLDVLSENDMIGVWTDQKDDKVVYVDHVVWIHQLREALEVGREHDQIAIWDIANNEEIRL